MEDEPLGVESVDRVVGNQRGNAGHLRADLRYRSGEPASLGKHRACSRNIHNRECNHGSFGAGSAILSACDGYEYDRRRYRILVQSRLAGLCRWRERHVLRGLGDFAAQCDQFGNRAGFHRASILNRTSPVS